MKLTPTLFRQGILASIALSVMALVCDLAFPGLVPDDLRAAAQKADTDAELGRMALTGLMAIAGLVALAVITVGLYRFRPWARNWNLYLCALSLPLCIAMGYMLSSGLAYALYSFASMIWGAVTFATFFSEVSRRFEKSPSDAEAAQ